MTITTHVFLVMLLACSILTTLTVEGVKSMFFANSEKRKSNIIAAVVAIIIAALVGIGYAIMFNVIVNAQYVVTIIALCFLSWLCSMVGYDKVTQAVSQIISNKTNNDKEESE